MAAAGADLLAVGGKRASVVHLERVATLGVGLAVARLSGLHLDAHFCRPVGNQSRAGRQDSRARVSLTQVPRARTCRL